MSCSLNVLTPLPHLVHSPSSHPPLMSRVCVCVCTQYLCHVSTVTENTQYLSSESGFFHFLWRPPVPSISRQFCPLWLNKLPHVCRICCVHLAADGQADCLHSWGVVNSAMMRMMNSASLSHHIGFYPSSEIPKCCSWARGSSIFRNSHTGFPCACTNFHSSSNA